MTDLQAVAGEGPIIINDPSTTSIPGPGLTKVGMAGYAVGQFSGSIFLNVPALLLMPFMTSLLGIPAALAGFVIFLPKIWVICCDLVVGHWSDGARAKGGSRSTFILIGGLVASCCLPLLFSNVYFPSVLGRAVFVMGMYIASNTAFSVFSVPYLAFAAELTGDPSKRVKLMAWRQAFNFLAALAGSYAPALIQIFGKGRPGYFKMAIVFGLISAAGILLTYFGTRHAKVVAFAASTSSFLKQIGGVAHNRSFLKLFGAYFMQMASVGVVTSSFAYLVIYQLKADFVFLSEMTLLMTTVGLLAQFLWVFVEKQFGTLSTYAICILGMGLGDGSYGLLGVGDRATALVISGFVGLFASGFSVMAWSLLLNVMALARSRAGSPGEGIFSGVWSAGEKVAIALGALLGGLCLQMSGFKSSSTGFAPQSDLAHLGIRLVAGGLTGAMLLLSLGFILAIARPNRATERSASSDRPSLPTRLGSILGEARKAR